MVIRRRNDPVRLFGKRLLLVFLFILIIAGGTGVWNAYRKERESALLNGEAQRQLSDLQHRQQELDRSIAQLGTTRGKEAVLRDQYALAAKGEDMIVIVDSSATQPEATSSAFAQWLHSTFPWW